MADNKYKSRFERSAKSMSEECVKNDIIGNQKDYRKSDLTVVKIPLDNLVEYTDKDFENMAGRSQPFMAYTEDALKDLADRYDCRRVYLRQTFIRSFEGKAYN